MVLYMLSTARIFRAAGWPSRALAGYICRSAHVLGNSIVQCVPLAFRMSPLPCYSRPTFYGQSTFVSYRSETTSLLRIDRDALTRAQRKTNSDDPGEMPQSRPLHPARRRCKVPRSIDEFRKPRAEWRGGVPNDGGWLLFFPSPCNKPRRRW